MEQPRQATLHQSINRPNLLMGGDQRLVLFAALIAGILAFALLTWWGIVLAAILWPCSVAALRRMAKADPLMRFVYRSHVKYAMYYPSKSRLRVGSMRTPANWR